MMEQINSSGVSSYFAPPKDLALWPSYLRFLLDHKDHVRRIKFSLRPSENACEFYIDADNGTHVVKLCVMDLERAAKLLAFLVPEGAIGSDPIAVFADNKHPVIFTLPKLGLTVESMPVFSIKEFVVNSKIDHDIFITELRKNTFRSLPSLNLPVPVMVDLLGLLQKSRSGIFAITGKPGKSTLSSALLQHFDDTSSSSHIRPIHINDYLGKNISGKNISFGFAARICDFVEDELLVWPVFPGYNDTSTGVLERFEDFGVTPDAVEKTVGWAAPRLFPILCGACSVDNHFGLGRQHGLGCAACLGTGFARKQMVLDIWEYDPNAKKSQLIQSAIAQASSLAEQGLTEWGFLDSAFGDKDMRGRYLQSNGWPGSGLEAQ